MSDRVDGRLSPFLRDRRIRAALPYLAGKVLDYGCGVGALPSVARFTDYVGVDVDEESLDTARRAHPTLRFMRPDALADERFDAISLLAVIEYLDRPVILRQLAARLEPGGRLVITTPSPWIKSLRRVLSRFGIVSDDIRAGPDRLPNRATLVAEAEAAGLRLARYKTFLLGANQLFVFTAADKAGAP
jgi:SAM-dependent methyltransferase